jgi:hypothetical protein
MRCRERALRRASCCLVASLGTFGCMGASLVLILSINLESVLWAMLAMGLAGFCNDLQVPGAWGACMDMGGKYAGALSGSMKMNMMGNLARARSRRVPILLAQRSLPESNLWRSRPKLLLALAVGRAPALVLQLDTLLGRERYGPKKLGGNGRGH